MNCSRHQDVVAVAQCSTCGVGLCGDCVSGSEYRVDNKSLCRNCNYETIMGMISEKTSEKTKTIIKLVLNVVFLLLGAVVFSESPTNGVILFAIGGVPTAWKMMSPDAAQRARNNFDDAVADHEGVGGGLVNMLIRFIFRVAFTVIIGAIAAPILLIVNIVKLFKLNKGIEENKVLLANFRN